MALERVVIQTGPGRGRAIFLEIEPELHPAGLREAIEREAQARIEEALPLGAQIELLARLVELLLGVVAFGGREVELLTPERLREVELLERRLQWLLDTRDRARKLERKLGKLAPEELQGFKLQAAENWPRDRAGELPARAKEKPDKPQEAEPGPVKGGGK